MTRRTYEAGQLFCGTADNRGRETLAARGTRLKNIPQHFGFAGGPLLLDIYPGMMSATPWLKHRTRNSLTPVLFRATLDHEVLNYRHNSTQRYHLVSPGSASCYRIG